jgi:hypothetical protein
LAELWSIKEEKRSKEKSCMRNAGEAIEGKRRNGNIQEANEKDSVVLVGSISMRGRDKKTPTVKDSK